MRELLKLFWAFFKIGALTFGGGYAMLPMLEREIIDKYGWCNYDEMLDFYAIAQATPGVIAVNTATFIGTKQKGVLGAFFATLGVICPSIVIILLVAMGLSFIKDDNVVQHAFAGIRVSVCALVTITIYRIIKKEIVDAFGWIIMLASFILIAFFNITPIFVVIGAAILGVIFTLIRAKTRAKEDKIEEEDAEYKEYIEKQKNEFKDDGGDTK